MFPSAFPSAVSVRCSLPLSPSVVPVRCRVFTLCKTSHASHDGRGQRLNNTTMLKLGYNNKKERRQNTESRHHFKCRSSVLTMQI